MSNIRSARINGEIKKCLNEIFVADMKDPRMSPMVNVTRVEATPDLKFAKVLVSIYDTSEAVESTMQALKSGEGFIRARLNDKIRLRRIPTLVFEHDTSIEYSARMSKLIDAVTEEDR